MNIFHFYCYVKIFFISPTDCYLDIIFKLLMVKAIVIPSVSNFSIFISFDLVGEVQSRHSSQVTLPHTIPKIPGSKTKSTIWLQRNKLIYLLKRKKEGKKVERKEGKGGRKRIWTEEQESQIREESTAADRVPEDVQLY